MREAAQTLGHICGVASLARTLLELQVENTVMKLIQVRFSINSLRTRSRDFRSGRNWKNYFIKFCHHRTRTSIKIDVV